MSRIVALRRELAQRALEDLETLALSVLEENPQGLEPNQLATALDILSPENHPRYPGGSRTDLTWGILHGLFRKNLIEKRGSRAFAVLTPTG